MHNFPPCLFFCTCEVSLTPLNLEKCQVESIPRGKHTAVPRMEPIAPKRSRDHNDPGTANAQNQQIYAKKLNNLFSCPCADLNMLLLMSNTSHIVYHSRKLKRGVEKA